MKVNTFIKYEAVQIIALMLLMAAMTLIFGKDAQLAVLAGGLIGLISNTYFTLLSFKYNASINSQKAVATLYRGVSGKMLLVATLSALAFKLFNMHQPWLLLAALTYMLLAHIFISRHVVNDMAPTETEEDK